MFIREQVVRKGGTDYRYLKVVENRWEAGRSRQETLVNLGNVANWPQGKLEQVVSKLSSFLGLETCELRDIRFADCRKLGPYLPLVQLWSELGLDDIIDASLSDRHIELPVKDYARAMVFSRLVAPKSKKAVWEMMEREVIVPGLTSDTLPLHGYYRALEYLNDAKPTIEKLLHARLKNLFNQDVSLVFYDLTSSYFEGKTCQMAKHGYSREHRPDCLQIQIGLLVDAEGVPIAHEVFNGNIKETTTVIGVLDRLKTTFGVRRCVFVSDDGMASAANLKTVAERGYEYITSLQLGNSVLAARLLRVLPRRSDFTPLRENMWIYVLPEENGVRYIASYNTERAHAVRPKRQERMRKCIEKLRQLAAPAVPGRARPDPHKVLAKAEASLRSKGCERFFRVGLNEAGVLTFRLDKPGVRNARQREGMMILTTNSTTLTDAEVADGYRNLWRVENAFRHIKDMVALRPIRHWKDVRVLGHVLVCVLAYTLERLLDRRLGNAGQDVSAQAALQRLSTITVANLSLGELSLRRRSEITSDQRKLLTAAGVGTVPEIW
jgi:hypothetical protein